MCLTRLVMIVLLAAVAYSQDPQPTKPACNKQSLGTVWREPAAPGERTSVEICTTDTWRYRWKPATVDFSELLKKAKRREPAGDSDAAATKPAN